VLSRGERGANRIEHEIRVTGDGPQIAVLHIGEQVEHGSHVVVTHDGRADPARDLRDIVEALRRTAGRTSQWCLTDGFRDATRTGASAHSPHTCTPFCGLSQTLGAAWPVEASDTRRSLPIFPLGELHARGARAVHIDEQGGAASRCCR
jgi:hypothetical protein